MHIPPTEVIPCACGGSVTVSNVIDWDESGTAYIVKRVIISKN